MDEAGPTQDLAVVIILNSNINASLSQTVSPTAELLLWGSMILTWGGLELFWGT